MPDHLWAPFLHNHDQTRTMTELGGDVARAKLASPQVAAYLLRSDTETLLVLANLGESASEDVALCSNEGALLPSGDHALVDLTPLCWSLARVCLRSGAGF